MYVCDNPLAFSGRTVQRPKAQPSRSTLPPSKKKPYTTEQKGKLLIRKIWQNGTDSVHDMSVVNTDAKSHLENTPEKCLQEE